MSSAFDLDAFAPPPVRFKLRGSEYVVDGDPDVDTVARMLRIEDSLDSDDHETILSAAEEARELLLEMIQARNAEVSELKVSVREILVVFPLIMRGPSVAAAVADALLQLRTTPAQDPVRTEEPVATANDGPGREGADGPLASARSSRGRSSSSASDTDSPADLVVGSAV